MTANAPQFVLQDPLWLLALLLLPLVLWLRAFSRFTVVVIPFSAAWQSAQETKLRTWREWLGVVGLAGVILALARPQRISEVREVKSSGYDIMLAIDLSGSMLAVDNEEDGRGINRLQAIKPVIEAFLRRRPQDRVGAVVFSGKAYTLAPLSLDHRWLSERVSKLKAGVLEEGTAIGDGLALAVARLDLVGRKTAGVRSGAFVILLTDGASNSGASTPLQAARLAKERGIIVHTVGIGQDGVMALPVVDAKGQKGYQYLPSDLDPGTLWRIAEATGGSNSRAYDFRAVDEIFRAIDARQKIEFAVHSHRVATELFYWWAVPGLTLVTIAGFFARWAERRVVTARVSAQTMGYWLARQFLIHMSGGTWRLAPMGGLKTP